MNAIETTTTGTALNASAMPLEARRSRQFPLARKVTLLLVVAGLGFAVAALCIGAVEISPLQVVSILASKIGIHLSIHFTEQQASVLWGIRLPRVLLGTAVGAGLAISGAVLQSLFRNPLADPGLIGVSTGSAFAISVAIVVGEKILPHSFESGRTFILPIVAFFGGITATFFVYKIGKRKAGAHVATMLLAGIAVNAFAVAGIGLMSFVATDAQLRNIMFWNLGTLAGATWSNTLTVIPLILASVLGMLFLARKLNVLLLGESEAAHLGMNVERTKWHIICLAALAVGAGVAVSGTIGFIGLIVPHLLRMTTGVDHRHLLINSSILGALMLVSGDILSRTALAPAEVPIGIVTALVGGPFFVWLLLKGNA